MSNSPKCECCGSQDNVYVMYIDVPICRRCMNARERFIADTIDDLKEQAIPAVVLPL